MPSIHRRALITWLAIFPLVCLGQVGLSPVVDELPLVVSALILTVVVVPVAVYVVVPFLLKANARISRRPDARR
ncbi:hypothetical protein [Phytoactinopolyspora alkaliphila]|nr:hypothetical protein [Phytoactinopolyspora alkaliphila]